MADTKRMKMEDGSKLVNPSIGKGDYLDFVEKWKATLEKKFKGITKLINDGIDKALVKWDLCRNCDHVNTLFPPTIRKSGKTAGGYTFKISQLYK